MARSTSLSGVNGVSSDGFTTTEFPVASAGARLFEVIISGWLNELRMPITPMGKIRYIRSDRSADPSSDLEVG